MQVKTSYFISHKLWNTTQIFDEIFVLWNCNRRENDPKLLVWSLKINLKSVLILQDCLITDHITFHRPYCRHNNAL